MDVKNKPVPVLKGYVGSAALPTVKMKPRPAQITGRGFLSSDYLSS